MDRPGLSVLLIEDDEDDYLLVRNMLLDIRTSTYAIEWAQTGDAALSMIRHGHFDICILDFRLGERDGLDLMRELMADGCRIPIVLLAGAGSYDVDIAAMKAGAADYLLKEGMSASLLERSIRYAIERKRAEQEILELNRTLEQRVRQRTFELEVMHELSQKIGYALSYNELLHLMLEQLHRIVPYEAAAIMSRYDDTIYFQSTRPLLPGIQGHIKHRLTGALERMCAEENVSRDYSWHTASIQTDTCICEPIACLGSAFQVPLITTQLETVGLLFVGAEHEKAFSEDHIRLLYTIAGQAALSIDGLRRLVAAEQERLQLILEQLPEGIVLLDAHNRIVLANPAAHRSLAFLGITDIGNCLTHLGTVPLEAVLGSCSEGAPLEIIADAVFKRVFEVVSQPLEADPHVGGCILVIRDVTREREVQEGIKQQQRLAVVGQLAAGVAHDFNNILGVMIGNAEVELFGAQSASATHERLKAIVTQGKRAAQLIRQILDFSRKSVTRRSPLELHRFLVEVIEMLRRILPESIRVELEVEPSEYWVAADLTQLQQVAINIALNARDAMPEGGTFSIRLSKIEIKHAGQKPFPEMPFGDWIRISFEDTGTGIPPEHLSHVFEPFFTTKRPDRGSGLGLSQVYGIVKQHESFLDIVSSVGVGTTILVYLPAVELQQESLPEAQDQNIVHGSGELILVVEDDNDMRQMIKKMLELLNFTPLTAASGPDAMELYLKHDKEIALVLTDMVMPGMGGGCLVEALKNHNPGLKAIFMTGHPIESEGKALLESKSREWIKKPFGIQQLLDKIRKTMMKDEG